MTGKIEDIETFTTKVLTEVVLKLAVESITASYPLLQLPFFKQLFTYIVEKSCIVVYGKLFQSGVYLFIQIKDAIDVKHYDNTVKDFKQAASTGQTKEINDAKQKLKDNLATLVKFKR